MILTSPRLRGKSGTADGFPSPHAKGSGVGALVLSMG